MFTYYWQVHAIDKSKLLKFVYYCQADGLLNVSMPLMSYWKLIHELSKCINAIASLSALKFTC